MTTAPALPATLAGFNREEFEDTARRRFFFGLAFEPYGGTAGLYDFGPSLCAMKHQMVSAWRQHFLLEEGMCEVDTTCLTPEEVFKASGHVVRFNDVMVRDTVTGECIRADKWLEEVCERKIKEAATPAAPTKDSAKDAAASSPTPPEEWKRLHNAAGGMSKEELAGVFATHSILSPKGNPLSEPFPFNLMFATSVGPEGNRTGYMRPELAQGIILNFKRLMDSGNAQRMPFAAAAIGTAFRNEIAPRAALIRVREFTLAEIEHFLNPNDKSHPKFDKVRDVVIHAWSREDQKSGKEPSPITIGDAVEKKIIDNESLGYFIARTALFLASIGVKFTRFRQHHSTEMAHYAQDCWDAELLTSYGWVECVGIADRSAYDLSVHSKASGKELTAREEFAQPKMVTVVQKKVNKAVAGKALGKQVGALTAYVEKLSDEDSLALHGRLASGEKVEVTLASGDTVTVTAAMVSCEQKEEKVTGRNYIPSVIEPSFGVGRILYAILEQSYWVRRDDSGKNEKRGVFSIHPTLAPYKLAILPLMMKPELEGQVAALRDECVSAGLSTRLDDSGAVIGKKYARIDELGIPFCVTIDYATDGTFTLRERDSSAQVRIPAKEICGVVAALCRSVNPRTWGSVVEQYPKHE